MRTRYQRWHLASLQPSGRRARLEIRLGRGQRPSLRAVACACMSTSSCRVSWEGWEGCWVGLGGAESQFMITPRVDSSAQQGCTALYSGCGRCSSGCRQPCSPACPPARPPAGPPASFPSCLLLHASCPMRACLPAHACPPACPTPLRLLAPSPAHLLAAPAVLSLGEVEWLHPAFHNEKNIFPVGYRATRIASAWNGTVSERTGTARDWNGAALSVCTSSLCRPACP